LFTVARGLPIGNIHMSAKYTLYMLMLLSSTMPLTWFGPNFTTAE